MNKLEFISFQQYLARKNIIIDEKVDIDLKKISNYSVYDAYKYLDILKEFHDKSKGYEIYFINKLENNIGKLYESYGIYVKRVRRLIEGLKNKDKLDEFEELLLDNEGFILENSHRCLNCVPKREYLNLIKRSMRDIEICIGSEGYYNLFRGDGIGLLSTRKCNYDLIEVDCIKFINRLKKGQRSTWLKLENKDGHKSEINKYDIHKDAEINKHEIHKEGEIHKYEIHRDAEINKYEIHKDTETNKYQFHKEVNLNKYELENKNNGYLGNIREGTARNLNLGNIINYFCEIENLGRESSNFIRCMTMFPSESMKYIDKYRKTLNKEEDKVYKKGLERAIEKDRIAINILGGM